MQHGLREAGIDFKFSKLLGDGKLPAPNDKSNKTEKEEEDEIYSLVKYLFLSLGFNETCSSCRRLHFEDSLIISLCMHYAGWCFGGCCKGISA